jgi:prolyl-tRNA editing enzyme YbaK/EbsC (Cys-tRNA(Pro) deacylase)
MSPNALRVQTKLAELGFAMEVVEMPESTRSAAEAARAIGCQVEQIAKSLLFRRANSQQPLLVIASGGNRVNEHWLARYAGEPVEKADAEFVRQQTGFAIGGVPPIGHDRPMETVIDQDLFLYDTIWAAAGTPFAVFRLTPADLRAMTGGTVTSIKGS